MVYMGTQERNIWYKTVDSKVVLVGATAFDRRESCVRAASREAGKYRGSRATYHFCVGTHIYTAKLALES